MMQLSPQVQQRWRQWASGWKRIDWVLFVLPVALVGFASVVLHSIQGALGGSRYDLNHVVMGVVGLVLGLGISRIRYELFQRWQWYIYGLVNLALVAVIFIGTVESGAQSWIGIGGFYIQPSEFAKLGIIITLAALLSQRNASTLGGCCIALAVTAVPWALVFVQPDLGTSLVFGAIILGMLYWANCNPGWLLLLASPLPAALLFHWQIGVWLAWCGAMGLVAWKTLPWRWFNAALATAVNLVAGKLGQVMWNLLHDYQKARLVLFLNPDQDPLGGGYHLIQSRIAIGAGQVWGQGMGGGTQSQLSFIPEQHTDFIFSAVGEEWGFVGAMAVLVVYWLICLRLVLIAQSAKDDFGSLLAIGVLSMVLFQVVVNVGMTIGLAPITGIPLPWISYGRSALLTNFMALGVVQAVANYRPPLKFRN